LIFENLIRGIKTEVSNAERCEIIKAYPPAGRRKNV
jgi:hypothetical protein